MKLNTDVHVHTERALNQYQKWGFTKPKIWVDSEGSAI